MNEWFTRGFDGAVFSAPPIQFSSNTMVGWGVVYHSVGFGKLFEENNSGTKIKLSVVAHTTLTESHRSEIDLFTAPRLARRRRRLRLARRGT